MKRRVKKVFRGCISLRDYDVKQAIETGVSIEVVYEDQRMILTPADLRLGKVDNGVYGKHSKKYHLIDYPWNPINENQPPLF